MKEQKTNWHRLTGADAVNQLKTNASVGLSGKEAYLRYRRGGANSLFGGGGSDWRAILHAIADPVWILLTLSCLLAVCFSESMLGLLTLIPSVAWLVFSLRCAMTLHREKEQLRQSKAPTVRVIREGGIISLSAQSVVRGDVILLQAGDVLPADCRLLSAERLYVRFSYRQTGEEKPTVVEGFKRAEAVYDYGEKVYAPHFENMLYGGSEILSGVGRAVVTEIGARTFLGAMHGSLLTDRERISEPKILSELLPFLRLYGFLALCLMLPLGIVGLFFSPEYMSAWRVFLPVCAFAATASASVSHFLLTILLRHVRNRCARDPVNGAVFYTSRGTDRLPHIQDLVVLGHAATSDGKKHFAGAYCAEASYAPTARSADGLKPLCEAFMLLAQAEERASCTENPIWDGHHPYLSEMAQACEFDLNALEVRLVRADVKKGERSRLLEVQMKQGCFRLHFYTGDPLHALSLCTGTERANGAIRPILPKMREELRGFSKSAVSSACETVSVLREMGGRLIFVGCLACGEKYLPNIAESLAAWQKKGVRVRIFLNSEHARELAYPVACGCTDRVALASEGLKLQEVGEQYRFFAGYSQRDVFSYIQALRKRGRRVAVIGNSESERGVLSASSLRISCVSSLPAYRATSGFDGGEARGAAEGFCAAQTVRREADLLIPTASHTGGGLWSLLYAIGRIEEGDLRLRVAVKSLFGLHLFRAVLFCLAVLTGIGPIHPAIVLVTSILPDLIALLFALRGSVRTDITVALRGGRETDPLRLLRKRSVWLPPLLSAVTLMTLMTALRLSGVVTVEIALSLLPLSSILIQVAFLIFGREKGILSLPPWRELLSCFSVLLFPFFLSAVLSSLIPTVARVTELGTWNIASLVLLLLAPALALGYILIFSRIGE